MKYREKKTGEIVEAIQFTIQSIDEVEAFVGGDIGKNADGNDVVATRQGALRIRLDDWIVKDSSGVFSAFGKRFFDLVYEATP